MKRQPLISKGALSRLFEDAAQAWRQQDYPRTIELLERGSRSDPANTGILLDLARAYGLRYNYSAAENCIEKALRLTPQRGEVLAEAAGRCLEFGHDEMTLRYFEQASKEKQVTASTLITLAELYERHSRLDQAAAMVARARELHPDDPRVLLADARLRRLQGRAEEAETLIETLLKHPACDATLRFRALYDLAALMDRSGRYDAAMTALLEAKAIQRQGSGSYIATLESVQARIRELEQTISASVLARWRASAPELKPTRSLALLCGHPRSGTTLLEQMLDAHPKIVSAEETQILHDEAYLPLTKGFAQRTSILQVLDSAPPSLLRQVREDYFRYTELFIHKPVQEKLLVDKNPALNALIPAVVRIFPEAKFLIALRDPRDVCLSCFMQPLPLNPVSSAYLNLESTMQQYASVMGLWQTILPRMDGQWMQVRYEDLIEDPSVVMRKTLEFLGLDWDENVLKFHEYARTKRVRSPSYADVVKPVYRTAVGRWRNYEKYLEPYLDKLKPFIKAFDYD